MRTVLWRSATAQAARVYGAEAVLRLEILEYVLVSGPAPGSRSVLIELRIRQSFGWSVNFFEKVDIGLVNNTSPLHRLLQVLGFRKLASLPQILKLQENHDLSGVINIA
jgi:hypothetical protein